MGDLSLKRPKGISQAKTFEQLGILVLDGSGSMEEQTLGHMTKAEAVAVAVKDLFSRFKGSTMKNNFSFAVVNYDNRSIVKMPPTPVKNIDDLGDYNPMEGLGGLTYISEGLKDAKKMAEDFLAQSQEGGIPRSVVVLIMTDGVDMTQPETKSVAQAIKQIGGNDEKGNPRVKICGCFFETLGGDEKAMDEAADYIKGLCSTSMDFLKTADPEMLRTFFIASMSNLIGGI